MTAPAFRLEQLADHHDRSAFECGEAALDRCLRTQAGQDARRRVASCFVAVETSSGRLAGYYTLASAGVPTPDLPPELTRRLPRYPTLPAVLIGRLAVDRQYHGRGLGTGLLADATRRTLQAPPAAFTLLVEAKDDEAAAFYVRHGFQPLATAEGAWAAG